ncbi:MAG: alpha-2-macroglobulin family protein [Opitutus sp.]
MQSCLLSLVLGVFMLGSTAMAASRDAEWKLVGEAERQGLPRSAIERLQPIIDGALKERAYPEAIRAIARRIALEGGLEGGKAEEKVVRLQAELEKSPAGMKPAMEAILAHWYWQYFQQNRWKFMQRTSSGAASGPDLLTWDLSRILAEIDRHFTAALANEAELKATPVSDYQQLLQPGTVPDLYRPTLYDFLTHEALGFFQAGEHAASIAEDEFQIEATDPIFGEVQEFLAWQPVTADSESPKLKAVQLYQSLLRFHQADRDRSAFLDADLARLIYANNVALAEGRNEHYQAALDRFIATNAKHEISARALFLRATQLNSEEEPAKALALAQRGVKAFPGSAGAVSCSNLIKEIEARSASLVTEHVWNAPWPTLDVTYRNITRVYFRAVPVEFADYVEKSRWGFGQVNLEREVLLAKVPALSWSAELPPTSDYKQRTENVPAPTTLKPGFYFIIASHDKGFVVKDNQLSVTTVWVSSLAMVMRPRVDGSEQTGLVLDARTGDPISGATVRLWQRDREGWNRPIAPTSTDGNGSFRLPREQNAVVALAEHDGQALSTLHEMYVGGRAQQERAATQTFFFTDRALYRPGQTINFKGVMVRYDRPDGNYQTLADHAVVVVFNDPNGQEIARSTYRTNDYGSFAGVFTAPRDRLMGRMSLQVLDRTGSATFNVEEYKRPKFQVALEAPKEAAKLDTPVVVTGKATAYTGVGIGGAKVKWRVQRGVQMPRWCWWWQPPAARAIAHGTAVTDSDGTFKIEFTAQPDRAVPEKNEPIFAFQIHADVTDTTGETRSDDRSVLSGYTALQASLTSSEWQTPGKPVQFEISTTSLDGEAQAASGKITTHELKQPTIVGRAPLQATNRWWYGATDKPKVDPTQPDSWEVGELVASEMFVADKSGKAQVATTLKTGIYRAELETADRFGRRVTARQTVQVVDPGDARYRVKVADHFTAPSWSVEPGEMFKALWGTGYDRGRAFVELECAGKSLKKFWTGVDRTQSIVELRILENMRGGFTVRVTSVRENRAYINERVIDVPWSNKQLSVKWETFRSKLIPGRKETWTAIVTGPDARRVSAEMVATLYDASLDQFLPHDWPHAFGVFRAEWSQTNSEFQNAPSPFNTISHWDSLDLRGDEWSYRSFAPEIIAWGRFDELIMLSAFSINDESRGGRAFQRLAGSRARTELSDSASALMKSNEASSPGQAPTTPSSPAESVGPGKSDKPDLNHVTARKNLNETAFFFPQLIADENGVVKIVFTMPEALTKWKLLGFAHDAQLRAGWISDQVVTAKDLMVEPNPPRFVREGDAIEFTVKVSNRSEQPQTGTVRLTFADAATQKSVDEALANQTTEQAFDVPANQSRSYSWRIAVPDGLGFLTYKAVAATAKLSDGEEGFLPVLSRRILVTESLPLPVRGPATKQFEFRKLIESSTSDTLKHQSLTVQMTSQPAWYAVMALPYLMEYPYECSEQIFNRYYANALARHIAESDPKIRRVFELWKNTPALESPLEKNQELKSVMLEETPWVRQAKSETQTRKNVGLLFDQNRLEQESARAVGSLADRQLSDGLWPWFPGGRSSEYISLYIATGFGRLRQLGVEVDVAPAIKSLAGLDEWIQREYREILKRPEPEQYVPSALDALYLYGRSFFLKDRPIAGENQAAVDFLVKQSKQFWLKVASRQSQGHLALALQRFGDKPAALTIVKSLKERSVETEEFGRFWRDDDRSWWWYHAPIETQALMIEVFAEVADDARAVEDCKVWLLKQKQTQDWRTTKATADAVYALLLRGKGLLASDAVVEVALGGNVIKPEKVEAGTGFYEHRFAGAEVKSAMGRVTVKKVDEGVSWGSVHWQYLEDVAKVTPHEGTPLTLKKRLFVKETNAKGQVLVPVTGPVAVGDELVVRLELKTDRDMEFVHLKDQRGSGTEPVSVVSRHRYQDGLSYYESTRDTASHFFMDYLPRGTYVFEYSTRVQLRGAYQSGIAEIQCMYAPEFNSHSESVRLEVK